ncbi:MAG: FHA domain-containing protein [Porticoccaceae bacterium]|nr:FHA domain-containing protein [Porticoccaceae bacterium]
MAIIIELLGWGGKRQRYFAVEGSSVTIGRSYQNDVVLGDVHISPEHLRLDANDGAGGGWQLTDLGSLNGVEVIKNPLIPSSPSPSSASPSLAPTILLSEGAELKIGRTRLRILSDCHPVGPAKELHHLEQDVGKLNRLSIWLPLFLISLILDVGLLYASSYVEWQWKNVFSTILVTQTGLLMLALFWGGLGRFLRNESHFISHYCLILMAGLAYSAGDWLIGILGYNMGTQLVSLVLSPLIALVLAALLLSANFALATNMLPRQRWVSALGFVMLIFVVSITAQVSQWGEFSPYPEYFSGIEIPALQFAGAESADNFVDRFDSIFTAADRHALD